MAEVTYTSADVKRLADVLDGVELSDEDRGVLRAVFSLAGHTVNEHNEVGGFSDSAIIFVGGAPAVGGGVFHDFLNPQPLPPIWAGPPGSHPDTPS